MSERAETAINAQDSGAIIGRLRQVVSEYAPKDGRYVVDCDDGSIIATDELIDGDDVLVDRGEDW